jgi:ABC-type branched-subunit amino acid transport system ATPase component
MGPDPRSRVSPNGPIVGHPRLLILDEATEGLAPLIRQEIYRSIARLKAEGLSLLVIEDANVQQRYLGV